MAKTTDNRGKTKTTKKKPTAAKAVRGKNKKTTAAKTGSKRISVAALFKRQSRNKKDNKKTTVADKLRKLNIASVAVFAALAAAAIFLMQEATRQISYGYLGRDALGSLGGETVFAPAWQPAFDIGVKWLVVALLVLSIVLPVLYLTKFKDRYAKVLKDRVNTWRWIDFAVTLSLMTAVIALLSGVSNIMTLELVAGLVVISIALAWITEKRNAEATADRPVLDVFVVSVISAVFPWLLIASYAINTVIYGMITAPWYVYALYAVGLVGFVLLFAYQWFQHRRRKGWTDFAIAEQRYLVLNLAVKSLFAIVLIVGFLR